MIRRRVLETLLTLAASVSVAAIVLAAPALVRGQTGDPIGIDIRDFAFEPRAISVRVGVPVRWVNRDDAAHSVVMEGNRPGSSGTLNQGGQHTFAFREAGRYAYRCGIHPTMLGEVNAVAP